MIKIDIATTNNEFQKLQESLATIGIGALSNTAKAISAALGYAQNTLSNYVAGNADLDGIGSIPKPFSPQKLSFTRSQITGGEKISVESKELMEIQNGKEEGKVFDMKTKYPYGRKSRVIQHGKNKGVPYLIIPFRWGTPNDKNKKRAHFNNFIPLADYKTNVLGMEKTFVSQITKKSPNARGELIERMMYEDKNGKKGFASRIKDGEVDSPISEWSGLHYSAGMVRMGDKANGKSTYWSFRIITPFQPQDMWRRKGKPAIPAIDIESAWARTVRDRIIEYIEAGLKADFGI